MKLVSMIEAEKPQLVTQSNRLVEARYSLSLGEQRLILTMISMIQPDDEDFKAYAIKIADLISFLGINNKRFYSQSEEIINRLMGRVLHIPEENGYLKTHWVSSVRYHHKKGLITLSFDPNLKPYLLFLKEQFTRFKLAIVAEFKSLYSIRIYQLLKQYESIGTRKFIIEELKDILGVGTDEYKLYADFKRRVIIPAQREINNKSDIHIEFYEIKESRKITNITFTITKQAYQDTLPLEFSLKKHAPEKIINSEYTDFIVSVKTFGITEEDALSAIEKHGLEEAIEIRNKVLADIKRRKKGENPVQDIGAYMATCFKQGYGKKTEQERKQLGETEKIEAERRRLKEQKELKENIKRQAEEERRKRFKTLQESLSPEDLEDLKTAFVAEIESGRHGELIQNAFHAQGWQAPMIRPMFVTFQKRKLLGPEKEDWQIVAKKMKVNLDDLGL